MSEMLRLALAKGKILDETLELLAAAGIHPVEDPAETRRLELATTRPGLSILVVRGWDVPTYVEYGAADAGVVGLDVLEEQGQDVYRPLDLGIGYCRLAVAVPEAMVKADGPAMPAAVRVATKYPSLTERYFREKGIHVEVIALSGSMELAPQVGLATHIVDLVSSGRTLREHQLVETETILASTAHLVVNRSSMHVRHEPIRRLIAELAAAVAARSKGETP